MTIVFFCHAMKGLKMAFIWSIYLFFICSPYLFPELTHNGSTLHVVHRQEMISCSFQIEYPPKQLTNQIKKKWLIWQLPQMLHGNHLMTTVIVILMGR